MQKEGMKTKLPAAPNPHSIMAGLRYPDKPSENTSSKRSVVIINSPACIQLALQT